MIIIKILNNYHLAKVNLIKNHRLKNSILFLQDYNLKNKFKSFDKNLFSQDNFISKNKISIINKSFNKYQITLKDKSIKKTHLMILWLKIF